MDRHGLVRGQRPGRRGPDHDACGQVGKCRSDAETSAQLFPIDYVEAHVDRRRDALLVFHLGLRKRGAAVEAPVHRLVALVQMAVADDLGERAQLFGLVARRQGQIRIVPLAVHAEALEIDALHVHLREGKVAARLPERARIERFRRAPHGFLDLVLDRQTVTVPARQVRGVVAVQSPRLDDDVLQHLVDRVADVDGTVRVRRTVVQDEYRSSARDLAQLAIGAPLRPPRQHLGLPARKIGLHGKCRRRQVDGRLVVGHGADARRRVGQFSELGSKNGSDYRLARACAASRCICSTSASSESKRTSSRRRAMKSTSRLRP